MQERHINLLAEIVKNYVREAEPIGSKALQGVLGMSSATIRNDMQQLEAEGYLTQPHTSAGRIPTVKGYQFYVQHLARAKEPQPAEQRSLQALMKEYHDSHEALSKALAKRLAEFAGEAAVVGFGPYDVYYTGLSNLFTQPEFRQIAMVQSIGWMIDHLDEAMRQLFRAASSSDVSIKLGDENPFGQDCAIVFTDYSEAGRRHILGLLGPLRMDYEANVGRLYYVRSLFAN